MDRSDENIENCQLNGTKFNFRGQFDDKEVPSYALKATLWSIFFLFVGVPSTWLIRTGFVKLLLKFCANSPKNQVEMEEINSTLTKGDLNNMEAVLAFIKAAIQYVEDIQDLDDLPLDGPLLSNFQKVHKRS